jgi:hypothetical protein
MRSSVLCWIDRDHPAADYYELLSLSRFHPDTAEITSAIRAAVREVMPLQNHRDRQVCQRALRLQMELGRAEEVFTKPARLEAYHAELIERLRAAYRGQSGHPWSLERLRNWLEREQNVHPSQVAGVCAALMPPAGETLELSGANTDDDLGSRSAKAPPPKAHPLAAPPAKGRVFGKLPRGDPAKPISPVHPSPAPLRPSRSVSAPRPLDPSADQSASRSSVVSRDALFPRQRPAVDLPNVGPPHVEVAPLELESTGSRDWKWMATGIAALIVVLLLLNVIVILRRHARTPAPEDKLPMASQSSPAGRGTVTLPPAAAPDPPATVTPTPASVQPSAIGVAVPAPGATVKWTGTLALIRGQVGPPAELHFHIQLDPPLGDVTTCEAFAADAAFAREVLDYVTTEERQEQFDADPSQQGDRVEVSGTIEAAKPAMRLTASADAPLVRLGSIQRVGQTSSRATVGATRQASSFAKHLESYSFVDMLRVLPSSGPETKVTGFFQGVMDDYKTVFISPGKGHRGIEVYFKELELAQLSALARGTEVEVTGTPNGQYLRRQIDGTLERRPILLGRSISRRGGQPLIAPSTPPVGPPRTGAGKASTGRLNPKQRGSDVLISSEEGLAAIRRGNQWFHLDLSSRTPRKINWAYVDRAGSCWLCGDGGLSYFNGSEIRSFDAAVGLPRSDLSHVFEDSQGRLWVCSWGGGVAMMEQGRWRTFTQDEGLHHDDVNGAVEDDAGRVWVAGHALDIPVTAGASTFVNGTPEPSGPGSRLPQYVMSLDGDDAGRIYLGCVGGMIAVGPDLSVQTLGVEQGLPQRTPQATFVDSRGRLWAGTWGGGAVYIDRARFAVANELALREAKHVRRIAEDTSGNLWVASLEGLWMLNDSGWQPVPTPNPIARIAVVGTLPSGIGQQLVAWAGAGAAASRPASQSPVSQFNVSQSSAPQAPSPQVRRPAGKPRSPIPAVNLTSLDGSVSVVIQVGNSRSAILKKLGKSVASLPFDQNKTKKLLDCYLSREGLDVAVVLVIYDNNSTVEYLDKRAVPRDSTDEEQQDIVKSLLEDYERWSSN